MTASDRTAPIGVGDGQHAGDMATLLSRAFAWSMVILTCLFVLNAYLSFWQQWPGALAGAQSAGLIALGGQPLEGAKAAQGWMQFLSYPAGIVLALVGAVATGRRTLRADSAIITAMTNYLIRGCFWAVVLVGIADTAISFMRVEGLLAALFGEQFNTALGRPLYRGPVVHMPLIVIGFVIAAFKRSLGFVWLAFFVVMAELLIVITRFIFSYEQAFQGDLVRFWYAALFLFASAYTLFEDGHVRVDVLYSGFRDRTRGFVNAFGCVFFGLSLCWLVLILGMWAKTSVIISPLLAVEVTQSGFGMFVKYLMAAFLAVFAVSMNFQFSAYFLESVADARDEPGKRTIAAASAH